MIVINLSHCNKPLSRAPSHAINTLRLAHPPPLALLLNLNGKQDHEPLQHTPRPEIAQQHEWRNYALAGGGASVGGAAGEMAGKAGSRKEGEGKGEREREREREKESESESEEVRKEIGVERAERRPLDGDGLRSESAQGGLRYFCEFIYISYIVSDCEKMYVCMYVCMHACMHVCMHVCMYVCMYVCVHACMHVCITIRTIPN